MHSAEHGIDHSVHIAEIGPSNGDDRRVEVLLEYVHSEQVNASKLRISRFFKGADQVLFETYLHGAMLPMRQSQGLLVSKQLARGTVFNIENCLDVMCAKTLDEE